MIGSYVRIGEECHIDAEGGVSIDDGTVLAANVVILSTTHSYKQCDYLPFNEKDEYRPVRIGKGVWIGYGAMIVPGVTIGDGAIIAMGAVVSKNVKKAQIVAGNPAKPVSSRDEDALNKMMDNESYYIKAVIDKGVKRRQS